MTDDRTIVIEETPVTGHESGKTPAAWRGRSRPAATVWLAAVAASITLSAIGCEVMSAPPPRPIDGLRMTGDAHPRAVAPSAPNDESKQADLRS